MSAEGGPGEYWKRQASPVSRIVNPELHVKPNVLVAAIGTGIFALILGNMMWTKYSVEKQQKKTSHS
ncbi:hypothetical protein MPTK1_8g18970 [Marchantia polymorpha subsp. ruderalis]|uniref:Uncharacterized protein n=1 Tax=Marchantia polymorpha TaxID=3197 RepID=A0A2R6W834_MARPO|nr:hypothetical protein MARPO_0131s0007 [Marchantia polymorpha]BBN20421.1 hypothetical protein Mp_8g18970 [Marchantia polymorpha subsp. ruderalis]|eukprot:PTQ30006.1 hypothetical protein MARPO_0131s0007 [Marchantia polymorpha]